MAYQMAATTVTLSDVNSLKVIHRLQAFSNTTRRTFGQHFTQFQLSVLARSLCVSLYKSGDHIRENRLC